MQKAFWPLDRLMDDLATGELCFAGSVPVMLDADGSYGEVLPSLLGFCSCFQRMADFQAWPLDSGPLIRLANRLQYGIRTTEADLINARKTVDRLKSIFMGTPVFLRQRAFLDESIAIKFASMGLKVAA